MRLRVVVNFQEEWEKMQAAGKNGNALRRDHKIYTVVVIVIVLYIFRCPAVDV